MPYCVPTSGCTFTPFPIDVTHAPERAVTGARVMSAFHGLSAGNNVHPELAGRGAAVVTTAFGAEVVVGAGAAALVDVGLAVVDVVLVLLVAVVSGFRTAS